ALNQLEQNHRVEIERLETARDAELRRAQESYRLCEEEKRQAQSKAENFESLFSSVQLDALRLSKDILLFLSKMGKKPEPDKSQFGFDPRTGSVTADTTAMQVHELHEARRTVQEPWVLRCESIWRRDFEKRVDEIASKFGIEGLDAIGLRRLNEELTHHLFLN